MTQAERAHLQTIPDSSKSFCLFVESLNFHCDWQRGWNHCLYISICVSSFLALRYTYVYKLIISLLSGALLGVAPARRLFLRKNFLIYKINRSLQNFSECASDAQLDCVQVCAFRKILGRHLTDLGFVASRLRGFVPHAPIPLLYRPPRKASMSRPLFWPKSTSRRLNQNQDPSKGQF